MCRIGNLGVVESTLVLFLDPESVGNLLAIVLRRIDQLSQLFIGVYLWSRVKLGLPDEELVIDQ